MTDHAKLSASGSHRWMNCPGSVAVEAHYPDERSKYAAEGSALHSLSQTCLDNNEDAFEFIGSHVDGFLMDAVKVEWVQQYVDYVNNLKGLPRYVEQRVDFSPWVPEGFGTADFMAVDGTTLHVVDAKFGSGVKVSAYWNPQQMLYGLGAYNELNFMYDIQRVVLHIVQPPLDHVDTFDIEMEDLFAWGEDVVRPAALAALADNAPKNPGESQCKFCKGRFECKVRANDALYTAQTDFAEQPELLDADDIARILPRLGAIESWIKDFKQHAEVQALQGVAISGYKLVSGISRRQWIDETKVIAAMRKLKYKQDDYLDKKIKPIGQIEKLLGGKKTAAPILETITTKPEGKPTLVPEADKRPALNSAASAAQDFDTAA